MVRRITVSIPDELHKRLQSVKHMFNISKKCSEAIERKVRMRELEAEGNKNVKQAEMS
jgi:metal-responsive CopG/Arc/MetJ family transcriptional regulator